MCGVVNEKIEKNISQEVERGNLEFFRITDFSQEPLENLQKALYISLQNGYFEISEELLKYIQDTKTIIDFMASDGNISALRFLFKKIKNMEIMQNHALISACIEGHAKVAEILIASGARLTKNECISIFIDAILKGYDNIIEIILQYDPDIYLYTIEWPTFSNIYTSAINNTDSNIKESISFIDFALKKGRIGIAEILKQHGAIISDEESNRLQRLYKNIF